ncbi:hypothetical protein ACQKKX_19655 [Neorhizobium sp. NPDC001467]|uniref:hypothetical protein n=1 Tax=Neorhizobium sp. NPDC001467 TaxID=3390595 RepID=UPI003D08B80C
MFETAMPEDIYSFLVMGVVALVVIWLVMFVVRKLIGIALVAALVIGGFLLWQDPGLLDVWRENAVAAYHEWQDGGTDVTRPDW